MTISECDASTHAVCSPVLMSHALQSLLDDLDVVEIFSGCSATWMHSHVVSRGSHVSEHELLSHGHGSGNLLAGAPARFQIQTDGYLD